MNTVLYILARQANSRGSFRCLAVVSIALVYFASPAVAVSLRPVPALPQIPATVTDGTERQILTDDRNRLQERRTMLLGLQADYRRDCASRFSVGHSLRRHCSFRLQEIYRQSTMFRRDVDMLRTRFRVVEENVIQRRHRAVAQPSASKNEGGPDARLSTIRDLLSDGDGGWTGVLSRARKISAQAPGNRVLRDAVAYLRGMYDGEIAAEELENGYYKHGVRRWLARDYWSATLAFARAARDHADDESVFASFAVVAGRQHGSPACTRSGRCVSGNMAVWVRRFGTSHAREVKSMLRRQHRGKTYHPTADLRRLLGAITVFTAKLPADGAGEPAVAERAGRALEMLRRRADGAAIREYIRAWQISAPRRAGIFFAGYATGSGKPLPEGITAGGETIGIALRRADNAYLVRVRASLDAAGRADPFSGALSRAQIIRLQRRGGDGK